MHTPEDFMTLALSLAKEALDDKEVPVGAVITLGDKVIATARNTREESKNALHHAELLAIDRACKALGGWRLWQCTLYVTLEPCPMCAGAIVNARIPRVYYGAKDEKYGACGSVVDLCHLKGQFRPEVLGGILAEESEALLAQFFARLRAERENRPRWDKTKGKPIASEDA